MSEQTAMVWLIRAAGGGGVVLLVAWWLMRWIESPARRQRLGEWALVAALCVAVLCLTPGWIGVRLPWPTVPAPVTTTVQEDLPVAEDLPEVLHLVPLAGREERVVEGPAPQDEPAKTALPGAAVNPDVVVRLVVTAYALLASAMLAWWLAGHVVLWGWLRQREPATRRLASLWAEAAQGRRVRLLVSSRVQVPFSCGLFRPTVVIPARMMHGASSSELLWVLHHELRHLERWDSLSAVLFGLGQSLFFFLPWFWWLRHEVRLCQEYLADQAAIEAGGDRVDYADFLAGWATAPRLPVAVPAVIGQGSDLFRRVRMLLEKRSKLESRCPRRWLLLTAGGLLSLAVLLAGVGPITSAVRADDKKPPEGQPAEKKKEDPKAKPKSGSSLIEELLKQIPADLDPAQAKMIRDQLEMARKQLEQAAERVRMAQNRFPGRPVIVGRMMPDPRLGVRVAAPSATLAEQLELPKGQGLVVEEVLKDSPAAKAGVKTNDVLLELAGKAVSAKPEQLAKQVADIEANKAVDAVVLRKGKKETLKGLTLPESKVVRGVVVPGGRRPGAGEVASSMLSLNRTGDQFSLTSREGTKSIVLRGKLVDGKAQASGITITDGRQSNTYDSIDKVPAESKEAVKALLAMCEKSAPPSKDKK